MGSCWGQGVVVSWKQGWGRGRGGGIGGANGKAKKWRALLSTLRGVKVAEAWSRLGLDFYGRETGTQGGDGDGNGGRRLAMVNASRVKVGGGDGLSSACKYFTLHSSQFSFRLGVSQSHNFASTLPGSDTHPLLSTRRLVPLSANT